MALPQARAGATTAARAGWLLLLATSLALLPARGDTGEPARAPARPPATLAVVGFTLLDTSGEPRDQRALHATRLQAMRDQIRAELARSGEFRITDLADGWPSAPAAPDPDQALAAARAAGADYALVGVVQKMSTLVLWCRASLVELATRKVVLDRWLTFRGDTDEAWQRAASFLTHEIEAHPPGT